MRKPEIRRSAKRRQAGQSSTVVVVIGVFKLIKAALLFAVAIGALRLLHRDTATTVAHWIHVLRVDPDNRFAHQLLAKVLPATPRRLAELSVGTFLYAALFSIEGIGLLLRKRWAEYFTIVTTGLLIPLEVLEIARRFTVVRLAVFSVNVLIVVYLVERVRRSRAV